MPCRAQLGSGWAVSTVITLFWEIIRPGCWGWGSRSSAGACPAGCTIRRLWPTVRPKAAPAGWIEVLGGGDDHLGGALKEARPDGAGLERAGRREAGPRARGVREMSEMRTSSGGWLIDYLGFPPGLAPRLILRHRIFPLGIDLRFKLAPADQLLQVADDRPPRDPVFPGQGRDVGAFR